MTEEQSKQYADAAATMKKAAGAYALASMYRCADESRYQSALAFYVQASQDLEAVRVACFGKSKSVH